MYQGSVAEDRTGLSRDLILLSISFLFEQYRTLWDRNYSRILVVLICAFLHAHSSTLSGSSFASHAIRPLHARLVLMQQKVSLHNAS